MTHESNEVVIDLKQEAAAAAAAAAADDKYLWLEDIEGKNAMDWVKTHSTENNSDDFKQLKRRLCEILDSNEKIPYVELGADGLYYNLWRDKQQKLGLWRRTTLDSYRNKDVSWESVLDLDELSKKESKTWVWHGAKFLKDSSRCLITLSDGGSDADETREFDLVTKNWVDSEKKPFFRPQAKGGMNWIDENNVFIYTDFGNKSVTDSGYPRIVKLWKRGQPLEEAETIYEGQQTDMYISANHDRLSNKSFVIRNLAFYNEELYIVTPTDSKSNDLQQIPVPNSANKEVHNNKLFLELRDDWMNFTKGSLIVTDLDKLMSSCHAKEDKEDKDQDEDKQICWTTLFSPSESGPGKAISSFTFTRNYLVLNILDNVKSCIKYIELQSGHYKQMNADMNNEFSNIIVNPVDSETSDQFFMTVTNYLTPSSLILMDIGGKTKETLKTLPAFFDASNHVIEQRWAVSDDKTRVPYFMICPKDMKYDSLNPTLMYGYGGFEVSLLPNYSAGVGTAWLSRDFQISDLETRKGVHVVANIRGGGEFGATWHQAALKEKRQRAYEDFSSVARDLIDKHVCQPGLLACWGGSNGGLLTGNMLTQYPELFGAIIIQVPLLDMKRYHKLLAGASWAAEYGTSETGWSYLQKISPYHLLANHKDTKGKKMPATLIMTSTKDDRVHPGHARKMTAKMLEYGMDVTYYENTQGGHGGAANNEQMAHMSSLMYTFLWSKLKAA